MYLVEVAPLTKIPQQNRQILSYFSPLEPNRGSLILVPLGRRQEKAIVIESHLIKDHKLEIKDAEYELRPIKKILSYEPVLTPQQIKLALWLGQYYFASPGLFMKMMRPGISNYFTLSETRHAQITGRVEGQKLILFPTVAQLESQEKQYPKNKTVIIHSGLKQKRLDENWQKIARGEAKIIIGTRLASFAPFFNLKEITIQNETDPGHRSWDMFPHYRTHEIARKLAELFGAKLTLKTATPSIEFFYFNSHKSLSLKFDSKDGKSPETDLVDLRQELKDGNYSIFSRKLQKAISDVLKKNQQVILFINRRGLATFVLCRDCGYVAKCLNCDAPLTYHLAKIGNSELKPLLVCHHCGQKLSPQALCPKCGGYRIKAFGTGTQRVEAEAKKIFKDARILRLDSDVARTFEQQNKIIQDFKQKKADILIGTQMLLNADLQKVPLAAIISADTLLHLPDFQSDEKTFQTIGQIKNFAQLHLIIQTYNPKAQILQAGIKQDFDSFYKSEIEARLALKYPPFSQIIKLVFADRDPKKAAQEAKILSAKLTHQLKNSKPPHLLTSKMKRCLYDKKNLAPSSTQLHNLRCGGKILSNAFLEISDAIPAFISKEKGRYVWQIIIKVKSYWLAPKKERRQLLDWRNKILMTVPGNWKIDVDPETLL